MFFNNACIGFCYSIRAFIFPGKASARVNNGFENIMLRQYSTNVHWSGPKFPPFPSRAWQFEQRALLKKIFRPSATSPPWSSASNFFSSDNLVACRSRNVSTRGSADAYTNVGKFSKRFCESCTDRFSIRSGEVCQCPYMGYTYSSLLLPSKAFTSPGRRNTSVCATFSCAILRSWLSWIPLQSKDSWLPDGKLIIRLKIIQ